MLRTKEFADLCGTTKETLFHYDRIGLLKPFQTLANGYRLYSPQQYNQFLVISLLKDTGCSLKDVQQICSNSVSGAALKSLKERRKQMKQQITLLKDKFGSLSEIIESLEEMESVSWNEMKIEKSSSMKLRVVPCEKVLAETAEAYDNAFKRWRDTREDKSSQFIPLGSLLTFEEDGSLWLNGFLFSSKTVEGSVPIKMKSGKYAVWYSHGSFEDHVSQVKKKLGEIKFAEFNTTGEIYCFDKVDLLINKNGKRQTVKYMVQVD